MLQLVELVKYLLSGLIVLDAKVIGTVGSDEKIEIAKENGYAHVINYTKMIL